MNPEIFNQEELNHLEEMKRIWKISPEQYWELLKASKEKVEIYKSIEESIKNLDKNSSLTIKEKVKEKIKLIQERLKKEKWLVEKAVLKLEKEQTETWKWKKLEKNTLNKVEELAKKQWNSFIEKYIPWWSKILYFFEKISNAWNTAKKVYEKKWFFASIPIFFWVLFWKKMLESKEELEKKFKWTKKSIQNTLEKYYSKFKNKKNLHPKLKSQIWKAINDKNIFSKEDLEKLKNILDKNWKITYQDLEKNLTIEKISKFKEYIFNPELLKNLKEQLVQKTYKDLENKYNLNLISGEKKQKAISLIRDLILKMKWIWKWLEEKLLNWDIITLWDIFESWVWTWIDFAGFFFALIWNGIIKWENLAINFYESGKGMFLLSLNSIWLKTEISIEKMFEKLQNLPEEQRRFIEAILYRKSWILASLIWWIFKNFLGLSYELISWVDVSSIKMLGNSFSGNLTEQIKNFEKLEKSFWKSWWTELLKWVSDELKILTQNYEIIQILNQEPTVGKAVKSLTKLNLKNYTISEIIELGKKSWWNIKTFRKGISEMWRFKQSVDSAKIWESMKNWLKWPRSYGFEAEKLKVIQNLDSIRSYQKQAVKTWWMTFLKAFTKLWEVVWLKELPRNIKSFKLEWKWLSKSQVLTKMEALSSFFKDFPGFARTFFWTIPTIAFYGLELNSKKEDESFLEAFLESSSYIISVFWPARLLLNTWMKLEDWWKIEWYDVAWWAMWWVLLWIDTINVWKILLWSWTWSAKALKIWKYILKPITDIWKFLLDSWKIWVKLIDIIKGKWHINWKGIEKVIEDFKKTKFWFIVLALVLGYIWYKEFIEKDYNVLLEKLEKKWIIDKNWEILDHKKLRSEINKLWNEEKIFLAEFIFSTNNLIPLDKVEIKIIWKKLIIKSKDKDLKLDILSGESQIFEWFKDFLWIWIENIDFIDK